MPIRLAIVDGHTLTRYGLHELMSQQPDIEIVAESGSAADARADIWRTRPDVVTVDVSLPDGNGLSLAREFRDGDASLGIVLLTSQEEDDVLFRALETGVSAFVAKSAPVADGREHLLHRGALRDESGNARLQRPEQDVILLLRGQQDDTEAGRTVAELPGQAQSVAVGQPDIHGHDARLGTRYVCARGRRGT